MNRSSIVWIVISFVVVAGVLFLTKKYYQGSGPANGNVATEETYSLKTTNDPTLGVHLVSSSGMTLYSFKKDTPGVSNCSGACIVNWPAYIIPTSAPISVESDVTGAVSVITREGRSKQATYNGAPLYFWKNDVKPGDTTGQGFNGLWFVVKP